jgi:NTE family protein
MAADANSPTQEPEAEVSSRRRGIGLSLSGGGFRATLFHAGVIQRLFELGVAGREEFETVASVSGGSITAAQWAVAEAQAAGRTIDFVRDVVRPLLALTRRDIRTGAMAQKYLLPWNWFRGAFVINNMIEKFEGAFGEGTLDLLPERPRFVFCGTDMAFGANFVFERERVGSYLAGYADPKGFSLAQAVAASACFPPLFGPMRIEGAAERFKGGRAPGVNGDERRKILSDLRVTDGGVYDNLGLEPVWKSHRVVLVSDAGGLMDAEDDRNLFWRIKRYQEIQEWQALGVRKRFLLSGFIGGAIGGAYVGVASAPSRYAGAREGGYSKAFAMEVIRNIRTDLDAFSDVEQGVLMNHGYSLIDAAIRTHVPELMGAGAASFAWPAPEFAPGTMTEEELRRRLAGSEKRKLTGRG